MNSYIENDWQRAIAADPRIEKLAEVAYELVRTGDRSTHTADAAYGDIKQYLSRLVGWSRGDAAPTGARLYLPESAQRMASVISEPFTGQPEDEGFLGSDRAYDVCNDVIFTNLCDVYDRRWSQ